MPEETTPKNPAPAPTVARPSRLTESRPSGPRPSGSRPGSRPTGPRKRTYGPRRKVCRLCAEKIERVDYKQFQTIRAFTTESGKILSGRMTGACAKHQRQITKAVKRNRNVAILPYISR